jgi:hypothetical protein
MCLPASTIARAASYCHAYNALVHSRSPLSLSKGEYQRPELRHGKARTTPGGRSSSAALACRVVCSASADGNAEEGPSHPGAEKRGRETRFGRTFQMHTGRISRPDDNRDSGSGLGSEKSAGFADQKRGVKNSRNLTTDLTTAIHILPVKCLLTFYFQLFIGYVSGECLSAP